MREVSKGIYFDGTPVRALPITSIEWGGGPLTIGAGLNAGVVANPFRGLIDDVRIYRRALSITQIFDLAQGPD